jgi:hypothetical protein
VTEAVPPSASALGLPPLAPPDDGAGRVPWKVVYTIVDRGKGRRVWLRVGVAFPNRDQSLNVRLDAVPISGQLHIRDALPQGSRDNEPLLPLPGADGDFGRAGAPANPLM